MKSLNAFTRLRNRVSMLLAAGLLLSTVAFTPADDPITITIQVSPNVLNIQNQGTWVTVHADIPYSTVVGATVTLNGVEVKTTFADNQGNLVAKFVIADIKGLPLNIGEYNTLTLFGFTKDGGEFIGSSDIKVINQTGR